MRLWPRDLRAAFSLAAAALWLSVTGWETLRPVGWLTPVPFWAFFTATMAGVDFVQNIVLFGPIGWIACRAGWTARRSVLAAFVISAGIEFAQQWVPGRTSTAMDIACNTSGAALGWWMATSAVRPRLRAAGAFVVLAAFLGLHVLNTAWPDLVERVDGVGVWSGVDRHACAPPARASTACIVVPNTATGGNKFVALTGPDDHAYAKVQSFAYGRLMRRTDCVLLRFESTFGAQLRLRPPISIACGLADTTDRIIELRVDPRVERSGAGQWVTTRASVWMWPVWPFNDYRPAVLRVLGAVTFVAGSALFVGEAWWVIPAGYLLLLAMASAAVDMRGPGWWEVGWAAIGWLLAAGLVHVDRWWRAGTPSAHTVFPASEPQ